MKVGIIPTCIDHFHDRIISLRREVWVHKNSLAPPLFFKLSVCTKSGK